MYEVGVDEVDGSGDYYVEGWGYVVVGGSD